MRSGGFGFERELESCKGKIAKGAGGPQLTDGRKGTQLH
jgi:hypothetical protein